MKNAKFTIVVFSALLFLSAGSTPAAEECPFDLNGTWELAPGDQEEKEALQMLGLTMTLTFEWKVKNLTIGIGSQAVTMSVIIKECTEEKIVLVPGDKNAADKTPLTIYPKGRDTIELAGDDGKEKIVFVRKATKK